MLNAGVADEHALFCGKYANFDVLTLWNLHIPFFYCTFAPQIAFSHKYLREH